MSGHEYISPEHSSDRALRLKRNMERLARQEAIRQARGAWGKFVAWVRWLV